MSHYGIIATHWNVNLGEIDEVQLHRIVRRGIGRFAFAPGELIWCSEVAHLIENGHTVWIIASDGLGKYKNTERVRVGIGVGGRKYLYSCTKNETPTSALTRLPRYLRPDDPLPQGARELLAKARAKHGTVDQYPTLTQRTEDFE